MNINILIFDIMLFVSFVFIDYNNFDVQYIHMNLLFWFCLIDEIIHFIFSKIFKLSHFYLKTLVTSNSLKVFLILLKI